MTSPIDPLVVGVAITSGDDTGPFPVQPKVPAERDPPAHQRRASSDAPSERYPAPAGTVSNKPMPQVEFKKNAGSSRQRRKEERLARFAAKIGTGDHDVAALASPFQDDRYPRQTLRLGDTRHGSNLTQPSTQQSCRWNVTPDDESRYFHGNRPHACVSNHSPHRSWWRSTA